MVKTKDEILEAIKAKIGEDTSDEAIALLEDVTDTLNDYDNKANTDTDWKAKYEENDKEWRKRYTDRFFNKGEDDEGNLTSLSPTTQDRYMRLFKEPEAISKSEAEHAIFMQFFNM